MPDLVLAYIVFLGALASPGPDFLITLRNALGYSTRAGIFTALGIGLALSIHFTYCIAGIALVISETPVLFTLIKWAGAGYLAHIGVRALLSAGTTLRKAEITQDLSAREKPDRTAFANGFITNLFNPKATMFFLALFSQVIDPATDWRLLIVFSAVCMVTAFVWFSFVSAIMGLRPVRRLYSRASRWIDRVFGLFFLLLALQLFLAES